MVDQTWYEKTDEIIAMHGNKPSALIPIIQDIQSEYRYLPPELLNYVAKQIGITEAKAFSVATFYENFSFEPKGKYEQPVMYANPFRFWSGFTVNWDCRKTKRPQMICCLLWKRYPVWVPVVWHRF